MEKNLFISKILIFTSQKSGLEQDSHSCHHDGNHRHQLNQNIQRRPGGILERVAYGISYHSSVMRRGVLASEVAFLYELLRIVPGTARVGEEDSENEARSEASGKKSDNACRAEKDTYEHRNYDSKN